jgi:hypothetical protein
MLNYIEKIPRLQILQLWGRESQQPIGAISMLQGTTYGCSKAIELSSKREIAMFKTIFAAAALFAIPTVASAEAAPKQSFSYEGVDYSYTVETKGDVRILKGTAEKGAVPFELRVAKGNVTGTINYTPSRSR